jgi:hypothetical protein
MRRPRRLPLSPKAFAILGETRFAYVKVIRSEDVPLLYPQAPRFAPGLALFALHAANGRPMAIADTRAAATEDAETQQLETMSVH